MVWGLADFVYCVWVFVAFSFFFCLVRCNILWNKNEQLERKCGCAASFPLPTGVGAVITNCLESQQCLSSSNISDVTYPSVSELQSKAELYKLALNETACVPTAMYLTSPQFFLHYFKWISWCDLYEENYTVQHTCHFGLGNTSNNSISFVVELQWCIRRKCYIKKKNQNF